jgi:hypothetical protein
MASSRPCACTHLQVQPRKIVFLSSFTIAPNNQVGNRFFYDRHAEAEFSVPDGWSFLVTDIIVYASPVQGPLPDPNRYILAVIDFTNGGDRSFTAAVLTDATRHFPLTSAFVIPGGHAPAFRNTTFSTSHAEANLLGYFVQDDGLGPGEPFFPTVNSASTQAEPATPLSRKNPAS